MHYNPFAYIRSEKDILKLVNTIIVNTKGEGQQSGEDFWVKAEKLYYTALIAYIWYEAPEEEQNFAMLIDMIDASEAREDDENFKNAVDLLFEELEAEKPNHFAVRQYKKYKLAAGKTAKSILISCGARLAPFDIKELRDLMEYDELELDTLGEEKTALFVIISDTDATFNFVVLTMYSQCKGLGTPATRADIIEKLVKDGFVKRDKKQMIPTEDGMKLITVLPDVVKSTKLTADWENALTLVAKGEMEREDFMADIEAMVSDLIHTYHEVSDEQKKMFAQEQKVLGKCPNCGGEVVKGKYGAFCKNKCGMNVSRIMGISLSDEQVESLLAGKKTLLKGLTSKAGKKYDAYIIPSGTEEYHYTKDGEEKSGVQFKFVMEFSKRKFTGKKK